MWSLSPGHYIVLLSENTGLSADILRIVICLLISFPFCAILKRLPDNNISLKNAYIISISCFYLFGIMNIFGEVFTLLFSSFGTYFITKYVYSPYMPWFNFIFSMSHLAYVNVRLQYWNSANFAPDQQDIRGALMVLVMKLTSFGWSVQDGRTLAQKKAGKGENIDELTPHQLSKAISVFPNIFNFTSYCFFFPSLMTGPSFDYADFDKWLNGTKFVDVPDSKRPGRSRKRLIPKNGTTVAWKFAQGVVWAVLWVKFSDYITVDDIFKPYFAQLPIWKITVLYYVLGFEYRMKYYAAWSISEAACILCGIGYNGYDENTKKFKWDGVQNIDPWAFETGQNAHVCLAAWNMNTNKWLKNYVYLRVKRKNKRPGFKSTLFTFLVSAFWHGLQAGYYISFVFGALIQAMMKIYRRNLRPIFLGSKQSKFVYDVICWIVTQLSFGYLAQPFVILDFERSLYCWGLVYYYPLIVIAITLLIFNGPFGRQVCAFLKKFHAKEPIEAPKDKSKKESSKPEVKNKKLAQIIIDKENYEECNPLGMPAPEFSKEEFERNMKEANTMAHELKEIGDQQIRDAPAVMKDAFEKLKEDVTTSITKFANEKQE